MNTPTATQYPTRHDCLAAGHTLTLTAGQTLGLRDDRWVCDTDGARYVVTEDDRAQLNGAAL